ncbi:tetratricopeptide repeat protein [Streptomyces kunmingensis]|uniref:Tetratricopeptide repeat protein n=1 Tax=Streptomyces kunmingensis TaxID=68225 RepID=A0ABU6CDF0_9ACTN|nr:tetratricopeptide repeat protein [Streptomyces kunmingensis]MEB3962177.1 tetratricopeptide repeat protein [Streptomyces kunmingensis]
MGDRVPTRRELIQQRRRSGFVGRQGELASFTEAFGQAPREVTQFLFHIHGPAGVGKSTLVRQMETEARDRQAGTGYVDESVADVVEALEALSGQFAQQGLALKDFDKAVGAYRQRRHEAAIAAGSVGAEAADGRGESEAGGGGEPPSPGSVVAAQVGLVALGMIPGVGAFTGPLDPHQVAAGAGQLKRLGGRFRSADDLEMVLAPLRALTPVFLKDLAEVARRRPWVVLFFDTYERIGPLLDVWLRDTLMLARYGDVPANVLVVLAGQTRLDVRVWADWLDLTVDLPLEVFTEAEARRYLAARHISDEQVVEVILRLSGRLPVLLSLLAEARPATAEDVGDPSGTAVERFLKWETDPARRSTALACALPAELDEDLYRAAAQADTADMFDWLRSLPFVSERAGRCRYHDVVRDAMLRLQRQQSPARWSAQHARLAAFHRDRRTALEDGTPPADGWWDDASWRDYRLQETCHHLCASPQAALPGALRELLDAYDQGLPVLRRWVQALTQAGRDADAPDITVWVQRLHTALGEQDPGTAFLTVLLAGDALSAESRSFAYLLRGREHRNAAQYPAALTDYDRSLELNPQVARAYYGRGLTHLRMEHYEQALTDLTRAIEIEPQSAENIAGRGNVYSVMRRHSDALTDYNHAIELNPDKAWIIANRGYTYRGMGRYEDALTEFDRAIELNPDEAWSITNRGQTYRSMGRYDNALTDFNHAIEIDPDDGWSWLELAVLYQLIGKDSEKAEAWRKAEELFTAVIAGNTVATEQARFNLFVSWCARSEWEKATRHLREILAGKPSARLAGEALADVQDLQQALRLDQDRIAAVLRTLETYMQTPPDVY